MRLLHPTTIDIVATKCKDGDFNNATVSRKQVISHAWCEVLKFKGTGQQHPKMFINDDEDLGCYMSIIKRYGDCLGCNLNSEHLTKYDLLYIGYAYGVVNFGYAHSRAEEYFNKEYLFSDAVSLYLKGLNIFPYIYGNDWQKYCPIINLKEVQRIVNKALKNEKEEYEDD